MLLLNFFTILVLILMVKLNGAIYITTIANKDSSQIKINCSSIQLKPYKILPSAIIIGVKKSGTYALLRYLSINPQVRAALKIKGCKLNEIHYFDQDFNYNRGIDWYKNQMPAICDEGQNQILNENDIRVIEKTPGYFRSIKSPERIYKLNPNMKIILIVRDPVLRIQSELTHCDMRQRKFNLERKCANLNSYFENIFNQTNKIKENITKAYQNISLYFELEQNRFIRNSIYYLDLVKWYKYFNSSRNMFILDGENFIKSPWIELNRLESFLEIKKFIGTKHFHFDKKKNFYCIKETLLKNESKQRNIKMARKDLTHGIGSGGCLGKNKGRKAHVYLSEFVKRELRSFFKNWNQLFFNLIGQDFKW